MKCTRCQIYKDLAASQTSLTEDEPLPGGPCTCQGPSCVKKERLEKMLKQEVDNSASTTVQDEFRIFANFDAQRQKV